jgi:nucleoside-triphosphatase
VDIEGLERVGVAALQRAAEEADIIVIDEIGKMELLSEKFKTTVLEIIESGKKALGTIMLKSDPWADMIKKKPQVQIITLNRNNRQEVRDKIMEWIKG